MSQQSNTIKTTYNTGDIVWVYGISMVENKLTKGTIVKTFELDNDNNVYFVVAVPTHIEPLLQVRTWETISQDQYGPVGGLRDALRSLDADANHKKMSELGYLYDMPSVAVEDDPSPEEINGVIDRILESSKQTILKPKVTKPRTRYYNRKKKL